MLAKRSLPQGGVEVVAVSSVYLALGTLFVALRFISRRLLKSIGIDDWASLWCLFLLWGLLTCHIINGTVGHAGDNTDTLPLSTVEHFLLGVYVDNLFYATLTASIKMTVILLYRRIFVNKVFRIATTVYLCILFPWWVAVFITQACTCVPAAGAWNPVVQATAKCINIDQFYLATAISNVLLDATLLVLPIPEIIKLQTSTKRKVQITALFLVGTLSTISAIFRAVELPGLDPKNYTGTVPESAVWTATEVTVGLICACVPATPHLFKRVYENAKTRRGRSGRSGRSDEDGKSIRPNSLEESPSHKWEDTEMRKSGGWEEMSDLEGATHDMPPRL